MWEGGEERDGEGGGRATGRCSSGREREEVGVGGGWRFVLIRLVIFLVAFRHS